MNMIDDETSLTNEINSSQETVTILFKGTYVFFVIDN